MNTSNAKQENGPLLNTFLVALKATAFGSVLMLILIIIFSAILAYTNISDGLISTFSYLSIILGALTGGYLTSYKIRRQGIFNGLVSAIILLFAVILIKLIVGGADTFSVRFLLCSLVTIVSGIIGGVFGVNSKRLFKK